MKRTESRPFAILDALILIAGLAVGLALVRAVDFTDLFVDGWEMFSNPRAGWRLRHLFKVGATIVIGALFPWLVGWTPACLLIQVLPPRPRWWRLRRRPGFVACLLTSAITAGLLAIVLVLFLTNIVDQTDAIALFTWSGSVLTGSCLLASWTTMRLCGVCRPRPTWTDRLGRLTGAAWVGVGSAGIALFLAEAL